MKITDKEYCICGCVLIMYEGYLRCADCERKQMIEQAIAKRGDK